MADDDIDCLDLQGPGLSAGPLQLVPPSPLPPPKVQELSLECLSTPVAVKKPFPLFTLPDPTQGSANEVTIIKPEPVTPPVAEVPAFLRPDEAKPRPDVQALSQYAFSQTPSCIIMSPPEVVVCKPSPGYLSDKPTSLFPPTSRTSKLFELPSEIRELSDFTHHDARPPREPLDFKHDFGPPPPIPRPEQHPPNPPFELQKVPPTVEGAKRIPGPAGEFQGRKANGEGPIDVEERAPGPDQDEDFRKGPWLAVLNRLKISFCDNPASPAALLSSAEGKQAFSHNTQMLQEGGRDKVPSLALLVKSVTFWNDNACVTFKDPWGTIEGSVHAQVWKQFPQLAAGSAVLLSNVTVFTPHSGNHYLNVVVANVREVYRTSTPLASFPPPPAPPSSAPLSSSSFPFPAQPPKVEGPFGAPSSSSSPVFVDPPSFPSPASLPTPFSSAPFPTTTTPSSAAFPLAVPPPSLPPSPAPPFPSPARAAFPSTPARSVPPTPLPPLLPPTPLPSTAANPSFFPIPATPRPPPQFPSTPLPAASPPFPSPSTPVSSPFPLASAVSSAPFPSTPPSSFPSTPPCSFPLPFSFPSTPSAPPVLPSPSPTPQTLSRFALASSTTPSSASPVTPTASPAAPPTASSSSSSVTSSTPVASSSPALSQSANKRPRSEPAFEDDDVDKLLEGF